MHVACTAWWMSLKLGPSLTRICSCWSCWFHGTSRKVILKDRAAQCPHEILEQDPMGLFLPLKKFDLHNKHQSYTMGTSQQFLDVHSMSPKKPSDFHRFPSPVTEICNCGEASEDLPTVPCWKVSWRNIRCFRIRWSSWCPRHRNGLWRTEQGHCFLNFCCTMSYLFLDSTNIQEQRRVLTAQLL